MVSKKQIEAAINTTLKGLDELQEEFKNPPQGMRITFTISDYSDIKFNLNSAMNEITGEKVTDANIHRAFHLVTSAMQMISLETKDYNISMLLYLSELRASERKRQIEESRKRTHEKFMAVTTTIGKIVSLFG